MRWQEWISILSGPLGIAITAIVAIYTIRKTAEENRVSNIHAELCSCLVDTVSILHNVLTLLDAVAKKVVYHSVLEGKIIETGYDRYWREISTLAEKFKAVQAKQRLVFPRKLYEDIQKIIKIINKARELVRQVAPDNNHIYPDTTNLQETVNEAISAYRNFLNESRKYLGTDKLKQFTVSDELFIKGKEFAKILEKNGGNW